MAPPESPEAGDDDGPALDAPSLTALEAALNGGSGAAGGMDFGGGAASLQGGGRIGATGRGGGDEKDEFQGAFSMSEIDQRPRAVHQVAAGYPQSMRAARVEGIVTLIFIVDETGRVVNPRVEKSSHPEFEAPALESVRQWRFEPAVKGGQRVGCRMRVPIRFQPPAR
ncbi:MAG: energy transducer TonB, partial [Phycisphaerales bacterium]